MIVDVVSSILFLTGAVFAVTAAIGIIRFPDTLTRMHAATKPQTLGMLLLLAGAFAVLTATFVQQDFSVRYVAENSNSLLPLVYRYTAVWGAHEGSLLLWAVILAAWTAAVARFSRGRSARSCDPSRRRPRTASHGTWSRPAS